MAEQQKQFGYFQRWLDEYRERLRLVAAESRNRQSQEKNQPSRFRLTAGATFPGTA